MKFIVRWVKECEAVVEADSIDAIEGAWQEMDHDEVDTWGHDGWHMETPHKMVERSDWAADMGVADGRFLEISDYRKVRAHHDQQETQETDAG